MFKLAVISDEISQDFQTVVNVASEYKLNGTFHLGTPYFSQAELRVEALNREVVPSWWDHVGPGSWELATYPAGFDFSPALAEEFTLSWTLRGDYTDPSGVRYVTDCGGSASGADAVRHFLMLALVYDPSSKKSEWAMNYIDMPWTYVQYRYPGDKGTLCEGNIRVEPRIVDPAHPFLPCDSERNPASGAVTGATVSWIRPFKGQDMLVQFSYPDIAPDPALDPAEPR